MWSTLGPAAVTCGAFGAGVVIRHGPKAGSVSFLLSWIWGLLVLLALIGWGRWLHRTLLREWPMGWGMHGALGLALTVVAGGVLNLAGVISPAVILVYLAAGTGLICWRCSPGTHRRAWRWLADNPALIAGLVLLTGLALLQYSSSISGTIDTVNAHPAFDMHDDAQAYLVFPEKMLETGSMGHEPFEARRALSLGGQSFLDTMVLVTRPVRALHLIDEGVALLILVGLAWGAGRRFRIGRYLTMLAVLLVLVMPHLPMRGNASALLTGVALLLAWFLLEMGRPGADAVPRRGLRVWVVLALPAAAACAVKSTFIPFAVPFFLLLSVADLAGRSDRRAALAEAGAVAGLIAVFVSPWMLSMELSSGTPLYPVLGHGFLGAASNHGFPAVRGHFAKPALDVIRAIWRHVFVLWPVAFLLLFVPARRRRRPVLALGAAASIAVVLYVMLGDPNLNRSLSRYTFPMLMVALIGLELAAFEGAGEAEDRSMRLAPVAGIVIAVAFFVTIAGQVRAMGDQMIINVAHGIEGQPFVAEHDASALAKLQRAVPPGATVLTTLRMPFLLDFARNRILIMSLPGFSSPPPGLPIDDGAEAVSRYLLSHHIRYLAYGGVRSLRDLLQLSRGDIEARYPHSKMRWEILTYHELYRKIVLELAVSRKVLYADGRRVLLDLATPDYTIVPGAVAGRHGFYPDFNWTKGDGTLNGFELAVPPGMNGLTVELYHVRPGWDEPAQFDVHVRADGTELEPRGSAPGELTFALPPALRVIHRIEIRSSVFVPRQCGLGNDGRTLGIPVERIRVTRLDRGSNDSTHDPPAGSRRGMVSDAPRSSGRDRR